MSTFPNCDAKRQTKNQLTNMVKKVITLVILITASLTQSVVSQDAVTITTGHNGQKTLNGRVVDYTGRELQLELSGGRRKSIPSLKVLDVATKLSEQNLIADSLLEKGDFERALAMYRRAMDSETRRWVRRQILAHMIRCYQALGQKRPACEAFLLLTQSDPDTLYFDCIPLAWLPSQPSHDLEQAAHTWLLREHSPVAVLLGASHMLSGENGPEALTKLKSLETARDRRISQLACSQTWRAKIATANEQEIDLWANSIDAMPHSLRAGPYFILGLAHNKYQRYEEAALAWLRVPILFQTQHELSARSLLEAGKSLEKLNRPHKAATLYSELIKKYPKSLSSFEARQQLENITTK